VNNISDSFILSALKLHHTITHAYLY